MPGDKEWFCAQVEGHKAALYRLARSILQNPTDAEDAVAEGVYKAYASLDRLRQLERPATWVVVFRRAPPPGRVDTLRGARHLVSPIVGAGSKPARYLAAWVSDG